MKMTLRSIIELHAHLRELAQMQTPVAYAIGKNFLTAERLVKDYEKIREDIMKSQALKDDDGNARKGLYSIHATEPVDPDYVESPDVKIAKDHYIGYLFEDVATIKEQLEGILDEEHEVSWHQINESRMEGCNVPAVLLLPLYDTIILEGR